MNVDDVGAWIERFVSEHSSAEDPDDLLSRQELRIAAVAIAQFARDAQIISTAEYGHVLFPEVDRLLSKHSNTVSE